MGLIVDTSLLIQSERRQESAKQILQRLQAACGEVDLGVSVISIMELMHGLFRAKTGSDHERRRVFVEGVSREFLAYPVTLEIAELAGRLEGEQATIGNRIATEDLLIGATALHLHFDVVTLNTKHFQQIPGLKVIPL